MQIEPEWVPWQLKKFSWWWCAHRPSGSGYVSHLCGEKHRTKKEARAHCEKLNAPPEPHAD